MLGGELGGRWCARRTTAGLGRLGWAPTSRGSRCKELFWARRRRPRRGHHATPSAKVSRCSGYLSGSPTSRRAWPWSVYVCQQATLPSRILMTQVAVMRSSAPPRGPHPYGRPGAPEGSGDRPSRD